MVNIDFDVLNLGFSEAWSAYKNLTQRDSIYKSIRFGIKVKFDINDYIKGRILTKPKSGIVLIRGKPYPSERFETELEDREKLMKEWLIENYTEDDLASPRGLEE